MIFLFPLSSHYNPIYTQYSRKLFLKCNSDCLQVSSPVVPITLFTISISIQQDFVWTHKVLCLLASTSFCGFDFSHLLSPLHYAPAPWPSFCPRTRKVIPFSGSLLFYSISSAWSTLVLDLCKLWLLLRPSLTPNFTNSVINCGCS